MTSLQVNYRAVNVFNTALATFISSYFWANSRLLYWISPLACLIVSTSPDENTPVYFLVSSVSAISKLSYFMTFWLFSRLDFAKSLAFTPCRSWLLLSVRHSEDYSSLMYMFSLLRCPRRYSPHILNVWLHWNVLADRSFIFKIIQRCHAWWTKCLLVTAFSYRELLSFNLDL